MKSNQETYQKTGQLLAKSKADLRSLVKKAKFLEQLNSHFSQLLGDETLKKHIQIANFRSGKLVLFTDSSAWHTKARFLTPELLKKLKQDPLFRELLDIEIKIRPHFDMKEKLSKTHALKVSSSQISTLESAERTSSDEAIRKAFSKLKNSAKKKLDF